MTSTQLQSAIGRAMSVTSIYNADVTKNDCDWLRNFLC